MRKLLYIDSSYTWEQIQQRGLNHVLAIRALDGYFDQIWSAHPVDTHPASGIKCRSFGKPLFEAVAFNHAFVRGRYGQFSFLRFIAPLNAVLALGNFLFTLIGIARREQIKCVRVGDPLLCGLLGIIVAKLCGGKLVVRINADNDMIRASTKSAIMPKFFQSAAIENYVESFVLKRADRVIVPSEQYAAFARRKGTAPDRIAQVRYGNLIDPVHLVEPKRRPALEDKNLILRLSERPWMVHIGRLAKLKHAGDCVEVLQHLAMHHSKVGLCLVGDGPLRGDMVAKIDAAGLNDRVLFLGNVDQTTLSRLLPLCTVVISPLTGRALSEAAFAGLPIVAYDLDWQRDIVETGVTGALVKALDTKAMADAVCELLASPQNRKLMGAAARKRAFDILSPEEQTLREIDVYKSLGIA